MEIEFKELNADNFIISSLDNFRRRQVVKRCWRRDGEKYILKPVAYIEDWTAAECRQMALKIIDGISSGNRAFGATLGNDCIGFALLDGKKFGNSMQYIDLAEFYVSEPFRRAGIGKRLFELACGAAKEFGAEKLYISAHSAEDSIAAYKSYGCVLAEEINVALAEKEPCDVQLEFKLK